MSDSVKGLMAHGVALSALAMGILIGGACGMPAEDAPSKVDGTLVDGTLESSTEGSARPKCRMGSEHDGHGHPGDDDDSIPPDVCATPKIGRTHHLRSLDVARCNGVDDTAAVQFALDRADEVRLPYGTCAVGGLGVAKRPITLRGRGKGRSVLKYLPRTAESAVLFVNGGHTVVTDLTIDGSADQGGAVEGIFIRPKGCQGPVVVARVEFRNIGLHAIVVSGSGSGVINNVVDDGPGVGASPVSILDNEIHEAVGGIIVATSSTPNISRVRIHGNAIDAGSDVGISVRGITDGQVFHNRVHGGSEGVLLESGDVDVSVTGNDVQDCLQGGVALGGGALTDASGILISGNRIRGCLYGVSVFHTSSGRFEDVAIAGNTLSHNQEAGVVLLAGQHLVVSYNQLLGNGLAGLEVLTAPPLTGCGARCSAIDDLTIAHNVFRAEASAAKAGLVLGNAEARAVRVVANDLRFDVPPPPYTPVDEPSPPAVGELVFDANLGWPTLAPAP